MRGIENCALLGYYAASSSNSLPTLRGNLSVPSSRVKGQESNSGFLTLWAVALSSKKKSCIIEHRSKNWCQNVTYRCETFVRICDVASCGIGIQGIRYTKARHVVILRPLRRKTDWPACLPACAAHIGLPIIPRSQKKFWHRIIHHSTWRTEGIIVLIQTASQRLFYFILLMSSSPRSASYESS